MVHLTYAVGDVHGSCDLLRRAAAAISRHARGREHQTILLGDYIDRGYDSRGCLDFLISYQSNAAMVCLKGNHEQMLIDCIDGGASRQREEWLHHGGAQTLRSYSLEVDDPSALAKLPRAHVNWLRMRPAKVESAYHIFVHAGIVPELPLIHQDEADFLWVRDRFVRARPGQFVDPRHVVHGHTCSWKGKPDAAVPELLPHRTNLDTGAYMTGVLSVGVFNSDQRGGPVDLLSIV